MSKGRSAKSPRSGIEIMDPNVSLRVATLQDIQRLPNIYKEFHNFHAESIPNRLVSISNQLDNRERTNLYQKLKKIVQSEDSEIFIAEANHEPIGLAEIYVRQDEINPLAVPYRYVYLQSLIITNSYRQQGIGTQLIEGCA
jgi:ribosomal protein S18 acetylase RimI-like enzyme